MKALGAVIDTDNQSILFKNQGNSATQLGECRGSYRLKLIEFPEDRREWKLPQQLTIDDLCRLGFKELLMYSEYRVVASGTVNFNF